MPSEKLRYLKKRPAAPLEREEIVRGLAGLGAERLSEIFVTASECNEPLRRIALLHSAFLIAQGNPTKLESVIAYCLYIDDRIPYDEEDAYSLVLSELKDALVDLGKSSPPMAIRLIDYALEKARKVSEFFEEGAYWEMSCKDLEKLKDKLNSENGAQK